MPGYVKKDGEVFVIKVPQADVDSLARFVAHAVEKNHDLIIDLAQHIVKGDLSKQDVYLEEFKTAIDLPDWFLVMDKQEALNLCDDLADAIYEEMPIHMATEPIKKERHLRIVKVCVHCHKGYVKGSQHDCEQI